MFSSVLVANRGEIACRVARTARGLGMRVIAVYSDADRDAPHVRLADEACSIGPPPAPDSYLRGDRIIEVACRAGAECIHPGYGFLSENAGFAEACARAGIVFVGPPPAAIRAMGLKDHAKTVMEKAGVPVVPGYHGERQEPAFLKQKAYEIGYPLLIKATAGGGGKGMRRVDRHADFEAALEAAQREAKGAFGEPRVLLERYVASPRHIEFQVFADGQGNVIHLNERDCSIQRRHQKVIEEAPAPGMTTGLRAEIGAAAVRAAKAVGYVGAGTVEFIATGGSALRADGFWFMEMNTRLQVEHPVTEAITGFDLVEWQFRIAAGEPLPVRQNEVAVRGHAVEARLYAEDPERGFLPSVGGLAALRLPAGEGIRVDTGVEEGGEVGPHYDPMIAKLIAHGPSRDVALDRLAAALGRTVIAGPRSNVAFLRAICTMDEFRKGGVDTGFIERHAVALGADRPHTDKAAVAAGALALLMRERSRVETSRDDSASVSPWDAGDGFLLHGAHRRTLPIVADGETFDAVLEFGSASPAATVDGVAADLDAVIVDAPDGGVYVLRGGRQTTVRRVSAGRTAPSAAEGDGIVRSPMHGKVLALLVTAGEPVARGQRLAIVEAMKMEHALMAPGAGTVLGIFVGTGSQVAEGAPILSIAFEAN